MTSSGPTERNLPRTPSLAPAGAEPSSGALRTVLAALVVAAVAVRWVRWESTAVLFNDGPVFLALAKAVAAGDWAGLIGHPFHPLYPVATALVHALGSPLGLGWESAGVLTNALAAGAAVVALHGFVRRAFGPTEAIFAAALLAFHAIAIEHGGDVQSEGLYLALFFAGAGGIWRGLDEGRARSAFVGGLCSGLAYLTRPEGLSLALVGAGVAAMLCVLGRWSLRATAAWGLALALGTLVCVAPYVGALWWDTGELWLTRKKSVAWVAGIDGPPRHFAGAPTVEPDWDSLPLPGGIELPGRRGSAIPTEEKSERALAREEIRRAEEPQPSLVSRLGSALFDLVRTGFRSLRYEVALLAFLGMFALRGPPGLRAGFIGAVIGFHASLLFGLVLNVGYVSSRHLLPAMALLLGYAACGVPPFGRGLAALVRRPVSNFAAAGVALLILGGIGVAKNVRPEGRDELAERRAAEWLRDHVTDEPPIATRKRRVAYYAELPFVQLRDKPLQRFVHYLDTHDVRYVVVNAADIGDYEGLEPLVGSWLRKVHVEEVEGETAWVLEYQPPHGVDATPGP